MLVLIMILHLTLGLHYGTALRYCSLHEFAAACHLFGTTSSCFCVFTNLQQRVI